MATLITGGTGLIGASLAEQLVARGERVVLFDVAPAIWRVQAVLDRAPEAVRVLRGDVLSLPNLLDAVRDHAVTAVVHLAFILGAESNADPELATRVNILGTVNVFEAARLGGAERVLLASSIAIYGADDDYAPHELPLREDATPLVSRGVRIYGAGKLYQEHLAAHYAERYGLLTGGLRPSVVYGWGRHRGASVWASALVDRSVEGEPVSVRMADARVSLVYVEDVAAQFVALLTCPADVLARRRFYNTGGDTCTVRELAETVRRLVPGARIDLHSAGEKDLGGLAARISDRSLVEGVGVHRRFTPLEVGVRAHIAVAQARAGQLPPEGRR